jgi:hypothetical protein
MGKYDDPPPPPPTQKDLIESALEALNRRDRPAAPLLPAASHYGKFAPKEEADEPQKSEQPEVKVDVQDGGVTALLKSRLAFGGDAAEPTQEPKPVQNGTNGKATNGHAASADVASNGGAPAKESGGKYESLPEDDGTNLLISDELHIPLSAVTETIGIVAQKGAGKTHTTVILAEEMMRQELQVVIIDPLGVYWGLRSTKDGEGEGCDVRILGGDHADLPLDPASGRAVARWVSEYKKSVILDIWHMRKAEQRLFVAEFAEELYAKNRTPMHLIMDEADLFMPQKPENEQKRVLLAFEDIVRRGRVKGIGITVVTQRPAVLHKDILTQVGTLIVLRMMGPQDRDAIKEWINTHDDPYKTRAAYNSLPGLPRGTAWIWSPGWLSIFQRVEIRDRWTFDSSATPAAGAPPPPMPNVKLNVDLDELRAELGHAFKYDPDDPKVMKLRIAELERAMQNGEGGSLVARLQKRIEELEKQLIARAGRGKGTTISVDSNLLAGVALEAKALHAQNGILIERVVELCERNEALLAALTSGDDDDDEEPEVPRLKSGEEEEPIQGVPDEEPPKRRGRPRKR